MRHGQKFVYAREGGGMTIPQHTMMVFFQLGQSGTFDVQSATLTNPSASCWPLDGPIFENNVNEPCCGMRPRYQEKMGMQSNDLFLLQPICR